ncbi:hypothetical protein [Nocardioides coralli]|uniref:hypothetical protein n=1 Tax=Nocardioides coralli TaxID=2872154 RepID=UPI001CA3E895|nr:hypothetical protein [Nocardioides coralli]QZY30336.1 hypothetical protein K6T13_06670 [Nocardioides coralli]
MAGGMRRRPELGSLAERSAAMRGEAAAAAPVPPPIRHCWVLGHPAGRLPGLLLGWGQRADGWHGRVVHPVEEVSGWVVVEEWLPASRLEPASDGPTMPG